MTDFFRAGTSRIGFSFDQSATGSSIDRHRPSFGLGKIVSPERHPVAVVEPFNEDDEEVNDVGFKFRCPSVLPSFSLVHPSLSPRYISTFNEKAGSTMTLAII